MRHPSHTGPRFGRFQQQTAQTRTAGVFALLAGSFRGEGSGAPSAALAPRASSTPTEQAHLPSMVGPRRRASLAALALTIAALATMALATAPAGASGVRPHLPSLSHAGFTSACGDVVDSHGNLYVADAGPTDTTVTVYDPAGATLASFVVSAATICNLAVDSSGNLYASTLLGPVTKYEPSTPGTVTGSTTYALDASIGESTPGANDGNGMIDPGPTKSVAVDTTTGDVYTSHPPVNEKQTATFPAAPTPWVNGNTFTLSGLPAACNSPTTANINYSGTINTLRNNINAGLEAACSSGAGDDFVINGNPAVITFQGKLAGQNFAPLSCTNTTSGDTAACSVANTTDGVPSYISQYHSNGALVTAAIGTGLTAANYSGLDVYSTNGRVFAFDAGHKQIAIFNPGAANANSTIDGSATPAGSLGASQFGNGLAIDQASGHVFAFDGAHSLVAEFRPSGQFVTQLTESLVAPSLTTDIAIDNSGTANDGTIYVADQTGVQAFGELAHPHLPSLSHAGFTSACGDVVDSHGNLYVADAGPTDTTVTVYDPAGATLASFVVSAATICNLAVDSSGNLYASTLLGPVTKYEPSTPGTVTGSTTYALDASIGESTPGANDGNGMIDPGPTKSVAVDTTTGDVYTSHPPVNEKQTATFPAAPTPWVNGNTFTLSGLPAACNSPTTANINYSGTINTLRNNINAGLEAACSSGAGDDFVINGNPAVITFQGKLAGQNFAPLSCTNTTSGDTAACSVANTTDGVPSYISQYHSNGALVTAAIGTGLTAANYSGLDVYSTNGRVFAFDAGHKQIAIFNPGAANANSTIDGSATPAGSLGASQFGNGLAIDQASGHVFAFDGAHSLVAEFRPSGQFVTQLTESLVAPSLTTDIAIDNSGTANDGTIYVADQTGVQAFGLMTYDDQLSLSVLKSGTGFGTITSAPAGIVCGATCDAGFDPGTEVTLTATPAVGSVFGGWSGCDQVIVGACKVTISANRAVTATFIQRTLTVSTAGPGTATITSSPAGIDCGATCLSNFPDASEVTLTPSAPVGSKFKSWSGCDSLIGEQCKVTMSANKSVTAMIAAQPTISGTSASAIGSGEATLEAKVNPRGELTTWHFELVDNSDFQSDGFENAIKVPVLDLSAGAAAGDLPVSRAITGLAPGTTYHFRLVATNFASPTGGTPGADSTFTTYTATLPPEPCSNDAFRAGAGARLPDCRAYEQASPLDKNGHDVRGLPGAMAASTDGDAVLYFSVNGQPDGVGSQNYPSYLSQRGADRWSSRGLLPPVSYGGSADLRGWSPDLSTVFSSANSQITGEASLLARDSASDAFTTIKADADATFVGASADGSIAYFAADSEIEPLAPGAIAGAPNLYAWDRATDTFALAGVLPDSACASPPCFSAAGSEMRVANPATDPRSNNLYNDYPIESHAVSAGGDAYFTDAGTGQLYLRKDPFGTPSTVHVSASQRTDCAGDSTCGGDDEADAAPKAPQPVAFQGATPDGSIAFFTSSEELTDDAFTGPEPVTPPQPPIAIGRSNPDGTGREPNFIPTSADWVAVDSGHVYWTDTEAGTIGRAEISGANPEPSLVTGLENPEAIAVDSGHIYWAEARDRAAANGTIGRADLNGGSVDRSFIVGAGNPHGVAVSPESVSPRYIYWTNGVNTDIGRAEISGANPNQSFGARPDIEEPWGLAVNATDLYWITKAGIVLGSVFKMNVNGGAASSKVVFGDPKGIALDSNYVYWVQQPTAIKFRTLSLNSEVSELANNIDGVSGLAIDAGHLYWSANPPIVTPPPSAGKDLYRYDVASGDLTDLAPDGSSANGAEVRAFLGASDDGEYVYFVANADLDGPGGQATAGDCEGSTVAVSVQALDDFSGQCSIYLLHPGDPAPSFVARLDTGGGTTGQSDAVNWIGKTGPRQKLARVSPGGTLLFRSQRSPSGYDNQGPQCVTDATPGLKSGSCPEFYRYAPGEGLLCVTCNPTGAPPRGPAAFAQINIFNPQPANRGSTLTRNLSTDGDRVFFESPDKLVAADVNGDGGCPQVVVAGAATDVTFACLDVYMWEAEGTGSCESSVQNGGCLYLISTGTAPLPAFFLDASTSGDDAFFFTREQLVPQDTDSLRDVYDARVAGGLAAQHAASPPPCEVNSGSCEGPGTSPSQTPGAATGAFVGPGNQTGSSAPNPRRCPKGRVRRGGRCVARHGHKKRKQKHHRRVGASNRTADENRRISR